MLLIQMVDPILVALLHNCLYAEGATECRRRGQFHDHCSAKPRLSRARPRIQSCRRRIRSTRGGYGSYSETAPPPGEDRR